MAVVLVLLLAGCGLRPGAEGASTPHAVIQSLSPAQHCEVTVLVLLGRTVTAVQADYPGGIDTTQVMTTHGEQSAVFQVFAQLDGQVIAWVDKHGALGATGHAVQRQALTLCGRTAPELPTVDARHRASPRILNLPGVAPTSPSCPVPL